MEYTVATDGASFTSSPGYFSGAQRVMVGATSDAVAAALGSNCDNKGKLVEYGLDQYDSSLLPESDGGSSQCSATPGTYISKRDPVPPSPPGNTRNTGGAAERD